MSVQEKTTTCSAMDGEKPCDRPATNSGWCNAHYLRVRRSGTTFDHVPIGSARQRSRIERRTHELELTVGTGVATDRRGKLRDALVGRTRFGFTPHPGPDSDEYATTPHCGNFGCVCPSLQEMDRIIERLLAL